jgi:HK97 family phage prohead protease
LDTEYGALLRIEDVKASDSGFEVAGYVSTYGNVDLGGDVVMRGAFDKTLENPSGVRFLYQHRPDQVLGVAKSLKSDDKGLFGVFKISKTTLGEDVHRLLVDKALDSFSIGFIPNEVEFDDAGTRLLKSLDLMEASIVSFPMNQRAGVTRVKADLPFDQLLQRAVEHLKLGVEEAEALHARRVSDKRELTERHVAAIQALDDAVKAAGSSLTALLVAPTAEVPGDLKLRLALARRLSIRRGSLEGTAA